MSLMNDRKRGREKGGREREDERDSDTEKICQNIRIYDFLRDVKNILNLNK